MSFARNPTSGFMILEFGFMIDVTRPIFQKSSIKNQKLRAGGSLFQKSVLLICLVGKYIASGYIRRYQAFKQIDAVKLVRALINLHQLGVPEMFLSSLIVPQPSLSHKLQSEVAVFHSSVCSREFCKRSKA